MISLPEVPGFHSVRLNNGSVAIVLVEILSAQASVRLAEEFNTFLAAPTTPLPPDAP